MKRTNSIIGDIAALLLTLTAVTGCADDGDAPGGLAMTQTTAADTSSGSGSSTSGSGTSGEASTSSTGTGTESSSSTGEWPDPVQQSPRRIFATGGVYLGTELGGYLGAIDICNEEAAIADLSGVYEPWLGGDHVTPALWGAQDYAFTGEYRLVGPEEIVVTSDGFLGLAGGALQAPIIRNARGEGIGAPMLAWTNVDPEGYTIALESTCGDWGANQDPTATQGVVGDIASKTSTWAYLGPYACAGGARLYCVETTIPWWETSDTPLP